MVTSAHDIYANFVLVNFFLKSQLIFFEKLMQTKVEKRCKASIVAQVKLQVLMWRARVTLKIAPSHNRALVCSLLAQLTTKRRR
jgi:hypothetical protein